MSDGSRHPRRISPTKLLHAIRSKGLTFTEAAERARRHLPPDARLSHTSIWSYATGRASPKRLSYIEAIEKAMEVEPHGLGDGPGDAAQIAHGQEPVGHPVEAPVASENSISIVDNGDGSSYLSISAKVPWPVAILILEKLKGGGS
jgi:hypothetical protein